MVVRSITTEFRPFVEEFQRHAFDLQLVTMTIHSPFRPIAENYSELKMRTSFV